MKARASPKKRKPFEIIKAGSISVPIYRHTNIIPQRDAAGKIVYGGLGPDGKAKALVKYESDIYTVAYYEGNKRIRLKFSDLDKARREANLIVVRLANGDSDALKLRGHDRSDYVRAMEKLRTVKPDANLNVAINEYVEALCLVPQNVSLAEVVSSYLKRHPTGLPTKTVREVVDELAIAKQKAGKSAVYLKDIEGRLGPFAKTFSRSIANVTGPEIEDYIRSLSIKGSDGKVRALAGRTQNNIRRLICTLFKFAVKRGYLPKDHDEMSSVEKATVKAADIEVFTPDELRKLFAACSVEVRQQGRWRVKEDMVPYLAIAAFCGLRAAEIERLDWSEVHLTGSEHFIEVKAGKAKTASRRTVPVSANCGAWLAQYKRSSGPVVELAGTDKQLYIHLAGKSGVPWKHNGLRHSYISYRLALIKDVGRVSLEAGNSPSMVFKHYRQLVRETEANDWFSIAPQAKKGAKILAMPSLSKPLPKKADLSLIPLKATSSR